MTATFAPTQITRLSPVGKMRWPSVALFSRGGLILPAALFMTLFLLVPAARLVLDGFFTQSATGSLGAPLTLAHYQHFFGTTLYSHVLFVTLRISLITAAAAAIDRARRHIDHHRAADRQRRRPHLWLAAYSG